MDVLCSGVDRSIVVRCDPDDISLLVGDLCHWCESDKDAHLVFEVCLVLSEGIEHLSGSLGVSDVGNFRLVCLLDDVVNHSWRVV